MNLKDHSSDQDILELTNEESVALGRCLHLMHLIRVLVQFGLERRFRNSYPDSPLNDFPTMIHNPQVAKILASGSLQSWTLWELLDLEKGGTWNSGSKPVPILSPESSAQVLHFFTSVLDDIQSADRYSHLQSWNKVLCEVASNCGIHPDQLSFVANLDIVAPEITKSEDIVRAERLEEDGNLAEASDAYQRLYEQPNLAPDDVAESLMGLYSIYVHPPHLFERPDAAFKSRVHALTCAGMALCLYPAHPRTLHCYGDALQQLSKFGADVYLKLAALMKPSKEGPGPEAAPLITIPPMGAVPNSVLPFMATLPPITLPPPFLAPSHFYEFCPSKCDSLVLESCHLTGIVCSLPQWQNRNPFISLDIARNGNLNELLHVRIHSKDIVGVALRYSPLTLVSFLGVAKHEGFITARDKSARTINLCWLCHSAISKAFRCVCSCAIYCSPKCKDDDQRNHEELCKNVCDHQPAFSMDPEILRHTQILLDLPKSDFRSILDHELFVQTHIGCWVHLNGWKRWPEQRVVLWIFQDKDQQLVVRGLAKDQYSAMLCTDANRNQCDGGEAVKLVSSLLEDPQKIVINITLGINDPNGRLTGRWLVINVAELHPILSQDALKSLKDSSYWDLGILQAQMSAISLSMRTHWRDLVAKWEHIQLRPTAELETLLGFVPSFVEISSSKVLAKDDTVAQIIQEMADAADFAPGNIRACLTTLNPLENTWCLLQDSDSYDNVGFFGLDALGSLNALKDDLDKAWLFKLEDISSFQSIRVVWIKYLYLSPEQRGKLIGPQVMRYIESSLSQSDNILYLTSTAPYGEAYSAPTFWEGLGFQRRDTEEEGEDIQFWRLGRRPIS
jgi:GNAT superfamily N-acetyltransferase